MSVNWWRDAAILLMLLDDHFSVGPHRRPCVRKTRDTFKLLRHVIQRKTRGWKTQGRGKTCHKTLPQKTVLDPPPTYGTFSPCVCSRTVVCLRGNRHRPDQSQDWCWRARSMTFPPHRIARYVLPPPHLPFTTKL